MYIHRDLEGYIKPFLTRKEALAIIGPRQAGKTTFLYYLEKELKKLNKSVTFLSFENLRDLRLFEENIDDFKKLYEKSNVIIIDEFHYAKDGGKKLKYLYDTTSTKFIISGSSSLELTFHTSKFMVGRLLRFFLMPFSFREFILYKAPEIHSLIKKDVKDVLDEEFSTENILGNELNLRIEKLFEEYLQFGGYPAVVLAKTKVEKEKILEGVFESYVLKDIRSLLQLATEDELLKAARFLSTQIGGLVKYRELSNVSGLKYNKLLKNLEILKQTYVLDFIKPYFTNKRTELTKNPKVYFLDSGLRNWIVRDFREIDIRNDKGKLVENFTYGALKRREDILAQINFWQTKSKAEVDFIVRFQQELIPIEVKYSSSASLGKSLFNFIKKFLPKKALVLTKGYIEEKKIEGCKVFFVPVYYV